MARIIIPQTPEELSYLNCLIILLLIGFLILCSLRVTRRTKTVEEVILVAIPYGYAKPGPKSQKGTFFGWTVTVDKPNGKIFFKSPDEQNKFWDYIPPGYLNKKGPTIKEQNMFRQSLTSKIPENVFNGAEEFIKNIPNE